MHLGVGLTRLLIWFVVFPRLLRWAVTLAAWTGILIAAVAAAPITTVAVTILVLAWWRGWPPVRLRRAAAWSLPITATWLLITAVTTRSAGAVIAAPFTAWVASWHAFDYGATTTAFTLAAPVAVPAGLLVASWVWQVRIYRIETGLAGATATAPVAFDQRQWHRQARTAQRRNTAPRLRPPDRPSGPDRDRRDHPRSRPSVASGARDPGDRDGPPPVWSSGRPGPGRRT